MHLSVDLFKEILGALHGDPSTAHDKRKEPRVGLMAEARIISGVHNGSLVTTRVQVRDISRSGLGITAKRGFALGQKFVLLLKATPSESWLICQVVACHRIGPVVHKIGIKVGALITPDDAKKLSGRMIASNTPNIREIKRIRSAILA